MRLLTLLTSILLTGAAITAAPRKLYRLDFNSPASELVFNSEDYWQQTYNSSPEFQTFEFMDRSGEVIFSFSHCNSGFGGDDVGGGMSYWDGFTFSRSGDYRDYGESGSSSGWVDHQWGCMAGGGLATGDDGDAITDDWGTLKVEPHSTYAVAFWSRAESCCRVTIESDDESSFNAVGIYVCAHPWPYYGIEHGDGFSRPFTQKDDFMSLTINGIGADGLPNGRSVVHMLATMHDPYRNGVWEPLQSTEWQFVDLSPLGEISGIYFTMDSSDSDPTFGMNTAAYFCLGGMTVESLDSEDTGIDSVVADSSYEWYTTAGLPVASPSAPGFYIRRCGTNTQKIFLK